MFFGYSIVTENLYFPRRLTKNNVHVFQPGETVPGIGEVETNHCGLPWPCGANYDQLFGVIFVNGIGRDAISGEILTEKEMEIRKDNKKFDYFESGVVHRQHLVVRNKVSF